jgi:hypothetical protein
MGVVHEQTLEREMRYIKEVLREQNDELRYLREQERALRKELHVCSKALLDLKEGTKTV